MCKSIIRLTECPFCEEYGEVYFDSRAATEEKLAEFHEDDSDAGVASGIFVYNSARPELGPCQHVVNINGSIETWWHDVDRNMGSPRVCNFDWYSPVVAELDPHREAWQLLLSLLECAMPKSASAPHSLIEEHKRFLAKNRPRTRYCECKFNELWVDVEAESTARDFEVYGSIVFAHDVTRLFRELKSIRERLSGDAAANGRS